MGFIQYFSIVVLYQFQGSDIALAVKCPDVLLFKIALDAVFFQFPYRCQAVHGVPCEPADALGDYQVDFPSKGIVYHSLETDPLFYAGPADSFVIIDRDFTAMIENNIAGFCRKNATICTVDYQYVSKSYVV